MNGIKGGKVQFKQEMHSELLEDLKIAHVFITKLGKNIFKKYFYAIIRFAKYVCVIYSSCRHTMTTLNHEMPYFRNSVVILSTISSLMSSSLLPLTNSSWLWKTSINNKQCFLIIQPMLRVYLIDVNITITFECNRDAAEMPRNA